jgi:ATP-binding cassette subfamily F protein uup
MVASEAANPASSSSRPKNIDKAFGDLEVVPLLHPHPARRPCIGLVGPNGAGKTTLLKMLTGELEPDSGRVKLGVNLEIATLDQKREASIRDETLAII